MARSSGAVVSLQPSHQTFSKIVEWHDRRYISKLATNLPSSQPSLASLWEICQALIQTCSGNNPNANLQACIKPSRSLQKQELIWSCVNLNKVFFVTACCNLKVWFVWVLVHVKVFVPLSALVDSSALINLLVHVCLVFSMVFLFVFFFRERCLHRESMS